MKKIFLSTLFFALLAGPAMATNGGGKKKAKKTAKVVCKKEDCDPKDCDPKNCDPKNCDPKNCNYEEGAKDVKCAPSPACTAGK